ncbi:MAG: alpha-galactosidase [Terracidiphilus sp.]
MISRRGFLGGISALSVSSLAVPKLPADAEPLPARDAPAQPNEVSSDRPAPDCGNSEIRISITGLKSNFWSIEHRKSGQIYGFAPPSFPVAGGAVEGALTNVRADGAPEKLKNGVIEYSFAGTLAATSELKLRMIFQLAPDNPIVRFRYSLVSNDEKGFTFDPAAGSLTYLNTSLAKLERVTQVQLSNWNALLHSDTLGVLDVPERFFQDCISIAGPILVAAAEDKRALLLAYEHGSQMPNTYLHYDIEPDRSVKLVGLKANYVRGQVMRSFDTVWMEASISNAGFDGLAKQFRKFVREAMDTKGGSRHPDLYYNIWNLQERDKWWNHNEYLSNYTTEKLLTEIDIAHRLGIEIFVMDTGWHSQTGDWQVNLERFPQGLAPMKAQLDQYGMRLGLWFNPTMAAVSSKVLAAHLGDRCTWMGKIAPPNDVWGSEASYPMCLVSDYSEVYADTLIRVARETGARYFIWDAVSQYGCDSPNHWHGTSANTQGERSESYAFQLPLQMVRIVEKVRSVYPEIIFDFDITEDGRAVGLGFLSAGRFFLANNGPYLADYDQPHKDGAQNDNMFFFPGPARTWICRKPMNYDEWIPSNLFLTHYYPDDPRLSQLVNMASLVLGQNGIWGNLSTVSDAGIEWMSQFLGRYKKVRQDVLVSYPITSGAVSSSYEAYEKINEDTGKGVAVLFSTTPGRMVYVTEHIPVQQIWATDGTKVSFDSGGHAVIESEMESGAAIVLFGAH